VAKQSTTGKAGGAGLSSNRHTRWSCRRSGPWAARSYRGGLPGDALNTSARTRPRRGVGCRSIHRAV